MENWKLMLYPHLLDIALCYMRTWHSVQIKMSLGYNVTHKFLTSAYIDT